MRSRTSTGTGNFRTCRKTRESRRLEEAAERGRRVVPRTEAGSGSRGGVAQVAPDRHPRSNAFPHRTIDVFRAKSRHRQSRRESTSCRGTVATDRRLPRAGPTWWWRRHLRRSATSSNRPGTCWQTASGGGARTGRRCDSSERTGRRQACRHGLGMPLVTPRRRGSLLGGSHVDGPRIRDPPGSTHEPRFLDGDRP
jgi:hypothetical protein